MCLIELYSVGCLPRVVSEAEWLWQPTVFPFSCSVECITSRLSQRHVSSLAFPARPA